MPLSFQCPYCGTKTLVDDQFAGQNGPCATCGKVIAVPFPAKTNENAQQSTASAAQARRRGWITIGLVLFGGLLMAGSMLLLLFILVAPTVDQATNAALELESSTNLERIALAMRTYAQDHGTYPPAYLVDSANSPAHSWRILLLPYLGHKNLYDEYNFDEPWNSIENQYIQAQMPAVYGCEVDSMAGINYYTSYVVVVGDRTMFPGKDGRTSKEITDAAGDTILVVESHDSNIAWMEPRDLSFEQMSYTVNGSPGQDIRSEHPNGGAFVVTVDGNAHRLDDNTSIEFVEGMLTIDGGEPIPWSQIEAEPAK